MTAYAKSILNLLMDKFEKSKAFLGQGRVNRPVVCKIAQLYPAYADDANYEVFAVVNEAVAQLEEQGLVTVKRRPGTPVVEQVTLVMEEVLAAYRFLDRQPKKERNQEIRCLLEQYSQANDLLKNFCQDQLTRLEHNQEVRYASDLATFEQILKVLAHILNVEEETSRRDFSVRILGDSKAFEKIESKVVNILDAYGNFPEKESILTELGVVRNPGYVYCKGPAILTLCGQKLDLGKLHGGLGIPSSGLKDIGQIDVQAGRIVTIENLTTFHAFQEPDSFAIYLGGYHNRDRREFILRVFANNRDKAYCHFGDIDAGGFLIWRHLCTQTGISFQPIHMGVETLVRFQHLTRPLTEHDRTRLQALRDGSISSVIDYMLAHNCKLEQEALDGEEVRKMLSSSETVSGSLF